MWCRGYGFQWGWLISAFGVNPLGLVWMVSEGLGAGEQSVVALFGVPSPFGFVVPLKSQNFPNVLNDLCRRRVSAADVETDAFVVAGAGDTRGQSL